MPLAATYCHSGPSWSPVQLVQVFPPSVESPQPLPTVPYQTSPAGPNPIALTKSNEMDRAVESAEWLSRSQAPAPARSTKIPCPYVPTQIALSGARAIASTWTPKPVLSGSGGKRDWAAVGTGAQRMVRVASTLRTPHSAFRTCSAPRCVNRRHQSDFGDVHPLRLRDRIERGGRDVFRAQHVATLGETGFRVRVDRIPDVRVHRPGRQQGGAHPGLGQLDPENLVQPAQAILARRVRTGAGVRDVIGHGADRDDVPAPTTHHRRDQSARQQEGSREVDREGALKLFGLDLLERLDEKLTRVVDEDIGDAERIQDASSGPSDGLGVGHVAAKVGPSLGGRIAQASRESHHVRARAVQRPRHGEADAP